MSEPTVEPTPTQPPTPAPPAPAPEPTPEPAKPEPAAKPTIAKGGNEPQPQPEPKAKSYWPEGWQEKIAEHYAAGDKKTFDKELARLQRYADPVAAWGKARELENLVAARNLISIPKEDASPEERAAFNKAMGVPEAAADYLKDLKLENGAILGEADKPLAESFASAMHKAGAPPPVVNEALNWYYSLQEQQASELDEADDKFAEEAKAALKEEYGAAFNRYTNAIGSLFSMAPGGTSAEAENGLFARLMGGRMADGRIIGNDPDMVRWLVALARDAYPLSTVTEGGVNGKSAEQQLAELDEMRKTDSKRYWSDEMQAKEQELLVSLEKDRARKTA